MLVYCHAAFHVYCYKAYTNDIFSYIILKENSFMLLVVIVIGDCSARFCYPVRLDAQLKLI
jgi:hypothetical protein